MKFLLWCAWACLLAPLRAADYPAPSKLGDPASLGFGVQRTMELLASSTPENRHTVRILFYGQSITEQDWWKTVAEDLKQRFPHANLVIENRALGGFSSQRLVKTAETDLFSFYPDLLIFHVYGAHNDYERIIQHTRQRTTAEILIQTDHLTNDDQHDEPTDSAQFPFPDGKVWNSFMNYRHLPEVARKYQCALLPQRDLWKAYLKEHGLPAAKLLKDGVHLNDHGNFLMAELVKAWLVRRDEPVGDPMNCGFVRTIPVDQSQASRGKMILEFTGNRVDVITTESAEEPVQVRIDGQRPSEFPELYGFTRALPKPGGKWPVVANLSFANRPVLERWKLEVKKEPQPESLFSFTLTGSETGPDGAGRSDTRFISNSGRVVIDPEDWDVSFALTLSGVNPVPDSFTVLGIGTRD